MNKKINLLFEQLEVDAQAELNELLESLNSKQQAKALAFQKKQCEDINRAAKKMGLPKIKATQLVLVTNTIKFIKFDILKQKVQELPVASSERSPQIAYPMPTYYWE